MKKLVNLWHSTLSGCTYEMPADWMPKPEFSSGWELIGSRWVEA